jgi:hypothetical protein
MWKIVQRLRALATPDSEPPAPGDLIPVRITKKIVTARGVLNAGEVATFSRAQAERYIAEGYARRASSHTVPDVHPRQDPEQAWRYVGRPLDDESQWFTDGHSPL